MTGRISETVRISLCIRCTERETMIQELVTVNDKIICRSLHIGESIWRKEKA